MNTTAPTVASRETARSHAAAQLDAPPSVTEIDVSCRLPITLLALSGAVWLVAGLLLTLISSIKLHAPGFLSDTSWLTIGRIRPAANNAILYGFASQTAIAVALWLFCRLGGNRLVLPWLIATGGVIWNAWLTLGMLAILAGASTGFEWLEMPRFVWPVLFVAYIFMGASALVAFHTRRQPNLYPSHWFLLAALFWFPWVYSGANLVLLKWPVVGTMQSVANAWFTHSFLWLWLGFIALAAIFYFVPKLLGRALVNWALAVFAFWLLLVFSSFGATAQLVGGPVPAWIASVGIGANMMTAAGIAMVAVIWHLTARGGYARAWQNPVLKFITFSAGAYLIASILGIILGLREVAWLTRLTYADVAQRQLAIHGFVSMALFGTLHYVLPRVLQRPWPRPNWLMLQFWLFGGGAALVFVALGLGGIIHGAKLNDPSVSMVNVVKATIPFVGLSTLGYLSLLSGASLFLIHLGQLLKADVTRFGAELIREVRS